ncbi:cytochrome P450 monooxygenase pc-1 [Amanita rubescens]|nr:cytochrome P450 monooxygenase pc-1 [Amanita rubescens]KAF8342541.1 cytochrome P450 monooxygenase pc-1 [Amanita rubescens]
MLHLTPGLRFLANGVLYSFIGPVVGGLTVQQLLARAFNAHVQTWVIILGSLSILPVATVIRLSLKEWKERREAAAMGAQVVPRVRGKWFGNLDVLRRCKEAWDNGYPGDYLEDLFDEHGSVYNVYNMYSDLYLTISPEHIKLMLATDFQNFVKGESFQKAVGAVLGSGVFNSDGDMWKFHRSISRPAFTRDRISDYELFDRHANVVIHQLKQRFGQGYAVNFQDLMLRFTLDAASEFLFGSCVHSLSAGLPYPHNVVPSSAFADTNHAASANAFAKALLEAEGTIADRERTGWIWPLAEMWEDKARQPMQIVDGYLEPIIREALSKQKAGAFHKKNDGGHLEEGETLLDHLVQVTQDPKVLKDETLNIMIAGRDTTASTLTFIFYQLAMHPQIMTRLRQEILDKVGPTRMPNQNDIRDMRYLRAVINETLRLYPIVPFNVRDSVNATTWPNPDPTQKPYYIPANTRITYSVFMMQRRKDLWGQDALEFDPDRFLDDRVKKYLVNNSFIFLPFNAGPRICLGQQFAYNEMSFMIIRLLQSFSSIALDPASAPPDSLPPPAWKNMRGRKAIEQVVLKCNLTMYSNGGLWVKMEEASTDSSHD